MTAGIWLESCRLERPAGDVCKQLRLLAGVDSCSSLFRTAPSALFSLRRGGGKGAERAWGSSSRALLSAFELLHPLSLEIQYSLMKSWSKFNVVCVWRGGGVLSVSEN